jgi:hypothetical protein
VIFDQVNFDCNFIESQVVPEVRPLFTMEEVFDSLSNVDMKVEEFQV